MRSLAEARAGLFAALPTLGTEDVSLHDAPGRTLAEAIVATRDQPAFAASAMDGYAVRFADVGEPLTVVGEAAAGHPFGRSLASGETVRIGTGAPVPAGADHVLIQEEAERDGDRVRATQPQPRPRNIRTAGRDFASGDTLMAAGSRVEARHIGLLAAANRTDVLVRRRPRIGVITSGDELVPAGQPLSPSSIVDSATAGLPALVRGWGAEAEHLGRAADDLAAVTKLWRTAHDMDLLVTVGGASVGERDLLRRSLEDAGGRVLWAGVAIRPGKPTWLGECEGTPILGLPGNPAAALVAARLLLRPAIEAMLGWTDENPALFGRLAAALAANGPREAHERASWTLSPDGVATLTPEPDGDSSRLSPFATCDTLVERPAHAPAAEIGDVARFRLI